MASTLLLDQVTWDLAVDNVRHIAVASDPYSQAQDAASSIKTFAGEVYYDTTRAFRTLRKFSKIAARFAHESIFQRSRASRPRRHQFPNVHYGMGRAHTFGDRCKSKTQPARFPPQDFKDREWQPVFPNRNGRKPGLSFLKPQTS